MWQPYDIQDFFLGSVDYLLRWQPIPLSKGMFCCHLAEWHEDMLSCTYCYSHVLAGKMSTHSLLLSDKAAQSITFANTRAWSTQRTLIVPAYTYLIKYLHSPVPYSLLIWEEETTGRVWYKPEFCVHWMSQGDMDERQLPILHPAPSKHHSVFVALTTAHTIHINLKIYRY